MTRPTPESFYRTIRLVRRFEERAIELVRSGEILGGIHPCIGQEAVAAGVGAALRADDIVFGNHRGHGHVLAKGTEPRRLMAELAGRATGIDRGRGGSYHPSDYAVGMFGLACTVGHQAAMATGVAWELAQAGSDRVAVSIVGDGAVSQGALLEAMNLAALWRVPQIFVCENNGYATTQAAHATIAGSVVGRAAAFGIPAATVDGMDPDEVYAAMEAAVARARRGEGPTLLEFMTYRFEGHHTFELRVRLRYRPDEEIARWRERDPLTTQGARIADDVRASIDAEIEVLMDDAVGFTLDSPAPDPSTAMDHVYATGLRVRAGTSES